MLTKKINAILGNIESSMQAIITGIQETAAVTDATANQGLIQGVKLNTK